MKILFFDIIITGHHAEYIGHLIKYLSENMDNNEYYFVVHPDFSRQFPQITYKAKNMENIYWKEISQQEFVFAQKKSLILKSVAYYKLMNKYAVAFNVDHVCLLYFNNFQFALGIYHPKYEINGILFLPFFRQAKDSMMEKIKYHKKRWQTQFYARNSKIRHIFILNDAETVNCMNKTVKKNDFFKVLPDPIQNLIPLSQFNIYKEYNIDRNRKIFLHIGSLSQRKGTLDILDCIPSIPLEEQEKICILLVGKANPEFVETLEQKVKKIQENSVAQILWDNEFVSKEKMKSLFEQCDCVLIPYKNPESSSGILGNAHISRKPVIGPEKGLLGSLIQNYNLGYTINMTHKLPDLIIKFAQKGYPFTINNHFLATQTPENFARTLIQY